MHSVDEPTEVEVRIADDGSVTPIAFVWGGRRMPVSDWGRTRKEGTRRFYMVMVEARQAFELCYDSVERRWRVTQAPNAVM
jgi:hypothetical protein